MNHIDLNVLCEVIAFETKRKAQLEEKTQRMHIDYIAEKFPKAQGTFKKLKASL
jgi:hypothetical protein